VKPGSKQARRKKTAARKQRRPSKTTGTRQYVFFYGTLKRGGRNYGRLREHHVRFVSEGLIHAALYNLHEGEFPGAVPSTVAGHFVEGELFVLQRPEETLRYLDDFEGVGEGLFRRELMEVSGRGRRVQAWVYLYAQPLLDADQIPSGVYSPR